MQPNCLKVLAEQASKSFVQYTRVHGCLIHIDIIDHQVWIQRDGTEDGIANDLIAAGVPTKDIVIGFHPPELRPYTKYAIAM
ncbi:element excision factor XisI family protein [Scytonema hofmannii]|uniref:element excision factor XisI family protein n=1 Tax=Scytonema hofmannii TaxID=34078 RepID=UPI0026CB0D93